jgi:hypothetical protein
MADRRRTVQAGRERSRPGRDNSWRCPGGCGSIEDVIDAGLLAGQAQIVADDDARLSQQLPAPDDARSG